METTLHEGTTDLRDPPPRVVDFVRRVIRGEKFYGGPERRTNLRYPITMPVRATELDEHDKPVNQPILGVTRDISIGGLCFYSMKPISQKILCLELVGPSDEHFSVLLEVCRCRATGPFFEVAGRFVDEA